MRGLLGRHVSRSARAGLPAASPTRSRLRRSLLRRSRQSPFIPEWAIADRVDCRRMDALASPTDAPPCSSRRHSCSRALACAVGLYAGDGPALSVRCAADADRVCVAARAGRSSSCPREPIVARSRRMRARSRSRSRRRTSDRIAHPVFFAVGKQVIAEVDSLSRGEPVYVAARSFPLWVFYTTDWRAPDVARLRGRRRSRGAGGTRAQQRSVARPRARGGSASACSRAVSRAAGDRGHAHGSTVSHVDSIARSVAHAGRTRAPARSPTPGGPSSRWSNGGRGAHSRCGCSGRTCSRSTVRSRRSWRSCSVAACGSSWSVVRGARWRTTWSFPASRSRHCTRGSRRVETLVDENSRAKLSRVDHRFSPD